MQTTEISQSLNSKRSRIEQHLEKLVPDRKESSLYQAVRYSLLGSCKRLRPLLTLITAESLGAKSETALAPACAIEMIHTYSLIHDDLPCMDNDDFRRGKPTLHKAFSESHAVLAGDFLLTSAFEIIADAPYLTAEQKVQLVSTLSHKAGGEGMIAGQVMDIDAEQKEIDANYLRQTHLRKTGALLAAAVECGGIVAGADDYVLNKLRQFGFELGLSFQVVDDVLDITSTQEKLGKPVGSDHTNNKTTYASLYGPEKANAIAKEHMRHALAVLKSIPYDTSSLQKLAQSITMRRLQKLTIYSI